MTEMSETQKKGALEAILFSMGKSVELKTLKSALDTEEEEILKLLDELEKGYENEDRGIRLIRLEDSYQLCTKREYYETLIRIVNKPQKPVLTETALEVLSIIAYKQPVTKGEIERIRGVSSDYSVNRLIEYGLVEEAGRLNAPGRPILFKTTEDFLRFFNLPSKDELPPITEECIEEAEKYASEKIDI